MTLNPLLEQIKQEYINPGNKVLESFINFQYGTPVKHNPTNHGFKYVSVLIKALEKKGTVVTMSFPYLYILWANRKYSYHHYSTISIDGDY